MKICKLQTKKFYKIGSCGLYYKDVTIVNDASSGVNKLKASLNDAARGVIYDRHVFIIQATVATACFVPRRKKFYEIGGKSNFPKFSN
jgi:hypothetical protein